MKNIIQTRSQYRQQVKELLQALLETDHYSEYYTLYTKSVEDDLFYANSFTIVDNASDDKIGGTYYYDSNNNLVLQTLRA